MYPEVGTHITRNQATNVLKLILTYTPTKHLSTAMADEIRLRAFLITTATAKLLTPLQDDARLENVTCIKKSGFFLNTFVNTIFIIKLLQNSVVG